MLLEMRCMLQREQFKICSSQRKNETERQYTMSNAISGQQHWLRNRSTYTRFLLRWGWFLALTIIVTTGITLLLPDVPYPPTYQATLQVQVVLPPGQNTAAAQATSTAFYAGLFMSPATLSLLLPQYPGTSVSDLQPLVLATPVAGTAIVQLSTAGTTIQDATKLDTAVFNVAVKEIESKRSKLAEQLTTALTTELAQSKLDAQTAATQLQTLAAAHLQSTYAYTEDESLYQETLQRVQAVSQHLFTIDQSVLGGNGVLKLLSSEPAITTVTTTTPTQAQRLLLSPLVGLLMGLGGVMLANNFSTQLPLSGKKRETILPDIIGIIPRLAGMHTYRLQALKAASPCTALFRHIRYQASEHERALHIITVTSAREHEGKSTVAIGLALAASQSGLRTLLVDANPQNPVLHTWFQLPNTKGLLNSLSTLDAGYEIILPTMRTPYAKISLLSIGTSPDTADKLTETLPVDALRHLQKRLLTQIDLVIFDGPSLLSDANAANLAQISDMTLLVVDAQRSQTGTVIEARNLLSTITHSSALVLNRTHAEAVA